MKAQRQIDTGTSREKVSRVVDCTLCLIVALHFESPRSLLTSCRRLWERTKNVQEIETSVKAKFAAGERQELKKRVGAVIYVIRYEDALLLIDSFKGAIQDHCSPPRCVGATCFGLAR